MEIGGCQYFFVIVLVSNGLTLVGPGVIENREVVK